MKALLETVAVGALLGAVVVRLYLRAERRQGAAARARAEQVISACQQYRRDRGAYPDRLQALLPDYLQQLPSAKWGKPFSYDSGQRHVLGWTEWEPFGRWYYVLEEERWGYLD